MSETHGIKTTQPTLRNHDYLFFRIISLSLHLFLFDACPPLEDSELDIRFSFDVGCWAFDACPPQEDSMFNLFLVRCSVCSLFDVHFFGRCRMD